MIDDQETLNLFLEESAEGLDRSESLLLEIEQGAVAGERVHALFRELHTVKGTSGCLDLHKIESIAHAAALASMISTGEASDDREGDVGEAAEDASSLLDDGASK